MKFDLFKKSVEHMYINLTEIEEYLFKYGEKNKYNIYKTRFFTFRVIKSISIMGLFVFLCHQMILGI